MISLKQSSSRTTAIVMVICVAVLVVGLMAALGGCGDKAGLVGKWHSASEAETVEFAADGKMTVTADAGDVSEFTYTTEAGKITVSVMGQSATTTYTVEGDTLTVVNLESQEPVIYERVK